MTAGAAAPSAPGSPPAGPGPAGAAVERLVAVLARLRSEDGCPWDRKQTWSSLRRFVLEEAHELAAAIDEGDPAAVREECGDLLLQVAFLSGIAAESGRFGLAEVAEGITAKLVRRHPQVFGDGPPASDAAEALAAWEQVKAQEQRERGGTRPPTLPPTLPALVAAAKVADRRRPREAAKSGPARGAEAALAALREVAGDGERQREGAADAAADGVAGREWAVAVGEALFAVAESAAAAGVDPEAALRAAVRRRLEAAPDGPDPRA